jgi:hypothetical protein
MSDKWHGGKGDKSRVSDPAKYQEGMERIYGRKAWQFWAAWEGFNTEEMDFDDSGLEDLEKISYKEYITRLKR